MESPNRATTFSGSFRCALAGIWHAVRTERNLKIQVTAAIVVTVVAAVARCSPIEWAVLVLAMGLVLVAETINTAAEAIVDLVSPDYHELAQIAKDVATRFLTVRRAEQQQRVLKQQIESLLEFQETTEKLFEAGEISKIGLNNIELELVTQQQMVREQQLQIDFELRALATQIGLDDPSSLSLQNQFAWQESIDQLMLHATDDGLNEWLAVHPQLTLARSLAAQSRWQIELAKQGRTPDVQVQGSLGIDTATDSIFAGFQVGVPILKYDDKRGQVSAAHAKYHDLLEYVRANERQLSINYVESAGTIARLKSRITNIRELRVPKAMENLEQIRSAYQIGEANFLTLKNGLDTVIQARMAQLAAEFELSVATIRQETFLLDEQLR